MSLDKLGGDQVEGESKVVDDDSVSLLQKILVELKLLNLHLSVITDEEPGPDDV